MEQPKVELLKLWENEQNVLKKKLITTDDISWKTPGRVQLIAGVDISFVKGDAHKACAGIVVMDLASREIVYEDIKLVHLTQPYISGFLAFREVDFIVDLVNKAKSLGVGIDLIMVDGNGTLHPRGFGLACHLGVLTGIPCIGIGKNFLVVDGMDTKQVKENFTLNCKKSGDYHLLKGKSGRVWGAAVKSNDEVTNPIFVSIGHRLSLESAIMIVLATIKHRVPEPVRQADIRSREFLRKLK